MHPSFPVGEKRLVRQILHDQDTWISLSDLYAVQKASGYVRQQKI